MSLFLNLSLAIDKFTTEYNLIFDQSKETISSSNPDRNQLITDLKTEIEFWKTKNLFDADDHLIDPSIILKSIKIVDDYFRLALANFDQIQNISKRTTEDFYQSIVKYDEQNLVSLMLIYLDHSLNLIKLLETGNDENRQKVINSLLIFPGTDGKDPTEFLCLNGSIARITDASLVYKILSPSSIIIYESINDQIVKLLNGQYQDIKVSNLNQIHLLGFVLSLISYNDERIDQYYASPDKDIDCIQALMIMKNIVREISLKINLYNQKIQESSDFSAFKQKWIDQKKIDDQLKFDQIQNELEYCKSEIDISIFFDFIKYLNQEYNIEFTALDLVEDQLNYLSEDCTKVKIDQLKSKEKIQELIELKLSEKYPEFSSPIPIHNITKSFRDHQLMISSESSSQQILSDQSVIDESVSKSLIKDQFYFLEQLKITEDFFSNSKKIFELKNLLKPVDQDPNKIKAGFLILKILARNFHNTNPLFCLSLQHELLLNNERDHLIPSLPEELADVNYELMEFFLQSQEKNKIILNKYLKKLRSSIDEILETTTEILQPSDEQIIKIYLQLFLTTSQVEKEIIINSIDEENKNNILIIMLIMSMDKFFLNNHEITKAILDQIDQENIAKVLKIKDGFGDTIIHIKSKTKNNLEFIEFLLDKITDEEKIYEILELQNSYQDTPIHLALFHQDDLEVFNLLIKKIDDKDKIEKLFKIKDASSNNVIHLLCMMNELNESDFAVVNKLDSNQILNLLKEINHDGYSPLFYAINEKKFKTLELFIKNLSTSQIVDLFDEIHKSEIENKAKNKQLEFRRSNSPKKTMFESLGYDDCKKINKILAQKNLKLDKSLKMIEIEKTSASESQTPRSEVSDTSTERVLGLKRKMEF